MKQRIFILFMGCGGDGRPVLWWHDRNPPYASQQGNPVQSADEPQRFAARRAGRDSYEYFQNAVDATPGSPSLNQRKI